MRTVPWHSHSKQKEIDINSKLMPNAGFTQVVQVSKYKKDKFSMQGKKTKCLKWDLNMVPTDYKSNVLTTLPSCTPKWNRTKTPFRVKTWQCILPLSICTSSIFLSLTIFFPEQVLQRCLASITSPCPRHSPHIDWICWTMPGPNCWIRTCMPEPLQFPHFWTEPSLPPRPVG